MNGFWARACNETDLSEEKRLLDRTCGGLGQGQILVVWILAGKLPNSDFNFALDFIGGSIFPSFFLFSSKEDQESPRQTKPSVGKNSPRISAEALS